ncbi:ATP-binding protein [Xanthomonas campestris]|uniref:ATP-binding protein n=1 Tax=Xanthomonas campestris TaxID=339 RepID=UPI003D071DEE
MISGNRNLFFNVSANRYARGLMVLTSNLPFTRWHNALADDQDAHRSNARPAAAQCHIVQIRG